MIIKARTSQILAFIATLFTGIVFLFLYLFIGQNQRKNSYLDSQLFVKEVSRNKANEMETYFMNSLMLARSLAQKGIIYKKYKADRKEIVNLIVNTLERSKNVLAIWTMWEPNAYDDLDYLYKNEPEYDKAGHLSIAYIRLNDSLIAEDTQPDEYLEDYYTIPKSSKKELILEPYFYQYHGYPKVFWESSVVVPIIVDSEFFGVFAIDFCLDSLRKSINKQKIYENGYMSLVSNNGTIVAHKDSSRVNTSFFDIVQDKQAKNAIIQGIELSYETISEFTGLKVFRFFYPIRIGNGTNPWSIMVEVPVEEATIRSKQLFYIGIGTLLVGLSLIIYLIINIFDRRRYERKLIEAGRKAIESDNIKTAFLNNISHEIRTPLNGILGFTELLSEPKLSTDQINNYKDIIRGSSNQLITAITNVLELSKIQTSKVEIHLSFINIEESISLVLNNFYVEIAQKGLVLKVNFLEEKQTVKLETDEYKFQQILSNLISNAIKFTKVGEIEVGYTYKPNSIQFYVKDTGVGIKPENAKKIFQFFTQEDQTLSRNFGGLGIGLSIAKSYTELLGGNISFESQPDIGTTFFFTLPMSEAPELIKPAKDIPLKELFQPQSVLVVEDEEFNLFLLREILHKINVKVFCASNGLEAIDICKKEPSISLVLMDIRMPVMNGYEATKIIKAFRKDLPIIAVTAFTQLHDSSEVSIFDSVLAKPFVKEEIINLVKDYLKLNE